MNIAGKRNSLRQGREKTGDVKAKTIRWYCILMSESEVNSQICLNNSLTKENLTIINEFLLFSLIENTNSYYTLLESVK